jgi:hypothetical protein
MGNNATKPTWTAAMDRTPTISMPLTESGKAPMVRYGGGSSANPGKPARGIRGQLGTLGRPDVCQIVQNLINPDILFRNKQRQSKLASFKRAPG